MASTLERFKQIEPNFNRSYLQVLAQLRDAMEVQDCDKDREQHALLQSAYERWSQCAPTQTESCKFFHAAVGNLNARLLNRDETFFNDSRDFLSVAYDTPGIDTMYIYNLLDDAESDAKMNFWTALVGLDRLSVLICIYLSMPQVKQMIDIILSAAPNVTQGNLMGSIMQQFKSKKELRQLVMKLMKTKTETFEEIFNSLQRVIATFNTPKGPNASGPAASAEVEALAKSAGVEVSGSPEQLERLLKALQDKNDGLKAQCIDQGICTAEAMIKMETLIQNKATAANLGQTMQDMMTAINSGDEKAIQTLFEKSGADAKGLNMSAMQKEMESLESEFESMEYESLAEEANIPISGEADVLWKGIKLKDDALKAQAIEQGVITAEDLVKLEALIADSRKESVDGKD